MTESGEQKHKQVLLDLRANKFENYLLRHIVEASEWALAEIERLTIVAKKLAKKNKSLDCLLKNRWCPDVCPITLLPFFMWLDHPDFGWVPTYGGPHDSYTIPEPEVGKCDNRHDVEYIRYRYDHDSGGWLIGECEQVRERVVLEDTLIDLGAWSAS